MRHQPIGTRSDTNARVASDDQNAITPAVQPDAAPSRAPSNASPGRIDHISRHLQSVWRLRQFAGSGYFGSAAMPRLMNQSAMAEVQHALARLGPFGNDRIDNFGRLHAALISANAASAQAVLTLVRHRIINPNQPGRDGDTLLHSLIEYGQPSPPADMRDSAEPTIGLKERIEQLIAAGANPNAADRDGRTAFERILSGTRPDWHNLAKALLGAAPARIYMHNVRNGPTLLHRAARHGDIALTGRWIELGLPTDIGIKSWRDISDPEVRTPLRRALKNSTLEGLEIAHMLLAAGANPHRCSPWFGNTILHRAACDADVPLIKGWIAAGLPTNRRVANNTQWTALMQAVIYQPGKTQALALLSITSEIDAKDSNGQTAVHHAVSSRSRSKAIDTLIAAGANLNIHANNGKSPLELSIDMAMTTSDDRVFWKLLMHSADLDVPNPVTRDTPRRLYLVNSIRWDGLPLPW